MPWPWWYWPCWGALYEVLAPLLARGADPWVVSQYLAFRVPEALVRGAPLAFLFALLLVLSRMGEESELKAMLAGGFPSCGCCFHCFC